MITLPIESDGSILHAATTTPPPGEVQPGDVVVRQEVWIADRPNDGEGEDA